MIDDYKPIIFNAPHDFKSIVVYFLHDLHFGSELFNERKWRSAKEEIMSGSNHFVIILGDMMENAVLGSKSDIFSQTASPQEQKEWMTEQIVEMREHIICGTAGNHERNRTTALCGLHPMYDSFVIAGIADRYRPHFCLADVGVGKRRPTGDKQQRYYIWAQHRARDTKNYSSADFIEGVDIFAFGHDHTPKDQARAHMAYDPRKKIVVKKHIETLNCGSGLKYGGYGVDGGYRPNADKAYKAELFCENDKKVIVTSGFYW